MNRPPTAGSGLPVRSQQAANTKMASKTQQLSDYRRRLRDAMKSANENIINLMSAVKIPTADEYYRAPQSSKAAHYNTVRYEVMTRSLLIIKALEELLALNNDVKSFMILRDFRTVNEAVVQSDNNFKSQINRCSENYDELRIVTAAISENLDKEFQEQFYRHF